MNIRMKVIAVAAMAHLVSNAPEVAFGQWFMNPQGAGAMQNPAMGSGFRGVTPNGRVGANPGPASTAGAPPIGTPTPPIPGDINSGGAFGGGSIASNGTLNGAVSNGFGASGGPLNGAGAAALGSSTLGFGGATDALLYSGAAYGGGGYGGQFTQDPVTAYATAYYSGMSNLLRSQGFYDVEESQAMINSERARTKYIDNQQKLFYVRQSQKRAGLVAHSQDREIRRADRARQEEFYAAHRLQPLSHEQLDPWSGTIQWPAALLQSEFDELRSSLDELFGQKARGYEKSTVASKIDQNVQEMRDLLRSQILTIPLHDYSEARKFLDSMAVSVH
jgi:hypothetical protein